MGQTAGHALHSRSVGPPRVVTGSSSRLKAATTGTSPISMVARLIALSRAAGLALAMHRLCAARTYCMLGSTTPGPPQAIRPNVQWVSGKTA